MNLGATTVSLSLDDVPNSDFVHTFEVKKNSEKKARKIFRRILVKFF